jgi:hypothetical protein
MPHGRRQNKSSSCMAWSLIGGPTFAPQLMIHAMRKRVLLSFALRPKPS